MTTAIVSGSFDPITYGHMDMIARAEKLFGRVVVAVAANSGKKEMFTPELRARAAEAAVAGMGNVTVRVCKGLLADLCAEYENPVIVRGARSGADFDYEWGIARANAALGKVDTVVLPAKPELAYMSSTYARELFLYGRDVCAAVPAAAAQVLYEKGQK